MDLATHLRLLCDPDGYRPLECPRCRGTRLHVHSWRVRTPRGAEGWPPVVDVLRYQCMSAGCLALWLVLPRFLARHLWRVWEAVEVATEVATPPTPRVIVPERTVRRWRDRLSSSARMLVQVLATSGATRLCSLATAAGLDACRLELARVCAAQSGSSHLLMDLAVLIHRLVPGVRLM